MKLNCAPSNDRSIKFVRRWQSFRFEKWPKKRTAAERRSKGSREFSRRSIRVLTLMTKTEKDYRRNNVVWDRRKQELSEWTGQLNCTKNEWDWSIWAIPFRHDWSIIELRNVSSMFARSNSVVPVSLLLSLTSRIFFFCSFPVGICFVCLSTLMNIFSSSLVDARVRIEIFSVLSIDPIIVSIRCTSARIVGRLSRAKDRFFQLVYFVLLVLIVVRFDWSNRVVN